MCITPLSFCKQSLVARPFCKQNLLANCVVTRAWLPDRFVRRAWVLNRVVRRFWLPENFVLYPRWNFPYTMIELESVAPEARMDSYGFTTLGFLVPIFLRFLDPRF